MAERRMFAKTIVLSDAFLDMPLGARCLYMTMGMLADDDGFINAPKSIMRQCGCSEDDLKMLIAKRFVIPFESGIIVIKHWRINNYLQKDRLTPTKYQKEFATLSVDSNGAYTESCIHEDEIPCIHENEVPCIHSIGKDSIDKSSIDKDSIEQDLTVSKETVSRTKDVRLIIEAWNSLNLATIREVNSKRGGMLRARIKEHGVDGVLEAIENIRQSDFLKGQNSRGWVITFDWFVKPNNFIKVLEGNYKNEAKPETNNIFAQIYGEEYGS